MLGVCSFQVRVEPGLHYVSSYNLINLRTVKYKQTFSLKYPPEFNCECHHICNLQHNMCDFILGSQQIISLGTIELNHLPNQLSLYYRVSLTHLTVVWAVNKFPVTYSNIRHCEHKSSPMDPTLCQPNPVSIFTCNSLRHILILLLHLCLGLPSNLFPLDLQTRIFVHSSSTM